MIRALAKPGRWTVERLLTQLQSDARMFEYDLKGKRHMTQGVPLRRLIEASQPKFDEKIKNHRVRFAVSVVGRDGHAASFSWAELAPGDGKTEAWVVTEEDGAALPTARAPLSLVVTSDVKPSRWVHGIAKIKFVDVKP